MKNFQNFQKPIKNYYKRDLFKQFKFLQLPLRIHQPIIILNLQLIKKTMRYQEQTQKPNQQTDSSLVPIPGGKTPVGATALRNNSFKASANHVKANSTKSTHKSVRENQFQVPVKLKISVAGGPSSQNLNSQIQTKMGNTSTSQSINHSNKLAGVGGNHSRNGHKYQAALSSAPQNEMKQVYETQATPYETLPTIGQVQQRRGMNFSQINPNSNINIQNHENMRMSNYSSQMPYLALASDPKNLPQNQAVIDRYLREKELKLQLSGNNTSIQSKRTTPTSLQGLQEFKQNQRMQAAKKNGGQGLNASLLAPISQAGIFAQNLALQPNKHQFQTMQASQIRSPIDTQDHIQNTQENFKGLIEQYYTQSHQVKMNYMTQKDQHRQSQIEPPHNNKAFQTSDSHQKTHHLQSPINQQQHPAASVNLQHVQAQGLRNLNTQTLPKYANKTNLARVAQQIQNKHGAADMSAFQRQENARINMISDYQKYNQKIMSQMDPSNTQHNSRAPKNGTCNPDEPILITQQSAIFQQKHQPNNQRSGAQSKTQGPPNVTSSKLGGYSREDPTRSPFVQSQQSQDPNGQPTNKFQNKLPKLKADAQIAGQATNSNLGGRKEGGSPGLYGSSVAMKTFEAQQNPSSIYALKHKRLSSNLTSKDKENFKNQFDTFRTIYQGENHAASKSAESHSSHKDMSPEKDVARSHNGDLRTPEKGSMNSTKHENIDSHDVNIRSPNDLNGSLQNIQASPGQIEVAQDILDMNFVDLEGHAKKNTQGQDTKNAEGQQTAQANEEKMKHLKQFIYMVDLFNVLETESKQAQLSPTPENNVQAHIEKRNKVYEQLQSQGQVPQDQGHLLIRDSNQNSGQSPTGTPQRSAQKPSGASTPTRGGLQGRSSPNPNIDANMWQHFQNLLKKNDNNPYLKEALQRQNSHGGQLGPLSQSQQQISRNFKKYIDDLTQRLAGGALDADLEEAGRGRVQNQDTRKRQQLQQLQYLLANNSSFAELLDPAKGSPGKSPQKGAGGYAKGTPAGVALAATNLERQRHQTQVGFQSAGQSNRNFFSTVGGKFVVGQSQAAGVSGEEYQHSGLAVVGSQTENKPGPPPRRIDEMPLTNPYGSPTVNTLQKTNAVFNARTSPGSGLLQSMPGANNNYTQIRVGQKNVQHIKVSGQSTGTQAQGVANVHNALGRGGVSHHSPMTNGSQPKFQHMAPGHPGLAAYSQSNANQSLNTSFQSASQFNLHAYQQMSQTQQATPMSQQMIHGQQVKPHQRGGYAYDAHSAAAEGSSSAYHQPAIPQIPMQISSTLFIMDCQTFGVLSNQKLLKLGPQSYLPGTSVPSSANYQLSEAQMVNFVMSRAQTCSPTPFLELPKLSEESKRILNTIKAQQHLNMVHEIQKIDTLIIEMDYFDYKNQILQSLFHLWGNKVLSNLVHKIEYDQDESPSPSARTPQAKENRSFQTIHEYINKIRKHHDDSIKLGNLQQQQLFSQINDFSSANENDNGFESYEMKSQSATGRANRNKDQLIHTRSSEVLEKDTQGNGGLEIYSIKKVDAKNSENKQRVPEKLEQAELKRSKLNSLNEEAFLPELQQLQPKRYQKRQSRVGSPSVSSSNDIPEPKSPLRQKPPGAEKKLKKKINFHVIVKNTKIYEALKLLDQQSRLQNQRDMMKNDAEDNSKGPLSMYQLSSEMSHQLNDLSSYIQTKDCSILRFALYCGQVGIVNSAQQLLRQFFKNIYVVVKPGSRMLPDGTIQHLKELPKVDIDKINKYLVQSSIRKQMAAQKISEQQQMNQRKGNLRFSEILPGQDIKNVGSRNCLIDQGFHPGSQNKNKLNHRYELKNDRDVLKKNFSLRSFKSPRRFNEDNEDYDESWLQTSHYAHHFNSGPSNIKVDGPQEKTTIKVIHKPYTHLDNSRIQKCFKIYNEFVQTVLKNRACFVQKQDGANDAAEFSKAEINKIYKLAYHMGIRLPKKNSASMIGRNPLLDTLRNHRALGSIKEQMIRFVHRILNEENGISHNVFQSVIMGCNFQNSTDPQEKLKKATTNADLLAYGENYNIAPEQASQVLATVGHFQTSSNSYYKYQVGVGNNHLLIRGLMRQRLWWHHIQRDKNMAHTTVQKLDFDEAQIMWTQWRKVKLYPYLRTHEGFKKEFNDLLKIISAGKIQGMNATGSDKAEKTKGESHNKILKVYYQTSHSPRNFTEKKRQGEKVRSTARKNTRGFVDNDVSQKIQKTQDLQPPRARDKSGSKRQDTKEDDEYSDDFEKNEATPVKHRKNQSPPPFRNEDLHALIGEKDLKTQLENCKRQLQKVYNRLEFNQHLNNKKALFINMRNYYTYCCENEDVFDTLPLTFHIKTGQSDPEFVKFNRYYEAEQVKCSKNKNRKNIWIIKPGENSNRGNGIKVESELGRIRGLLQSYCSGNGARTMILQKYIDNPLLYQRRKFDFRCFSLVTCHNGVMKAYFYRDGYLRTSSKEYNHQNLNLHNKYVHLVNDAVQKYSEDYGKYEPGNKLSYQMFQTYLTETYPDKYINVERDIIMQIKKIVTDTIRATFHVLDPKKRVNSFELFGYDFMFDDEFKPFLIEVNSNPSLEPSCNLLTKLFSVMLDNTFRLAIDPLFPPSEGFSMKKGATGIEVCPENRFDLIFDERIDGPGLRGKFDKIGIKEMEEVAGINELSGSGDEAEEEGDVDGEADGDHALHEADMDDEGDDDEKA